MHLEKYENKIILYEKLVSKKNSQHNRYKLNKYITKYQQVIENDLKDKLKTLKDIAGDLMKLDKSNKIELVKVVAKLSKVIIDIGITNLNNKDIQETMIQIVRENGEAIFDELTYQLPFTMRIPFSIFVRGLKLVLKSKV